jgi:hypothetical protein
MADADRCVCCGEIVPEGRQVCPRCEIELQSKPDVGAVLGVEEKIDENLISEDWIKIYKTHLIEFYELCGFRLTFAQKIILRTVSLYERTKDRRRLR